MVGFVREVVGAPNEMVGSVVGFAREMVDSSSEMVGSALEIVWIRA